MKVDKQQIELVCLFEPEVLQLLTFIKIKQGCRYLYGEYQEWWKNL